METEVNSGYEALVAGARAGDREAFTGLYESYFTPIYDFVYRLMNGKEEAADVTQETFIKAMEALPKVKGELNFKPWLYAIARNTALNELKRSRKVERFPEHEAGSDTDIIEQQVDTSRLSDPEKILEDKELVDLVWQAARSLPRKQYSLLDLHLRQGLSSGEIAEVMGITKANAYTMLSRLKSSIEAAITAFIMMRRGRRECPELDTVLADFTGTGMTPPVRKAVENHIESCPRCTENRKRLVSPLEIFGALVPVLPAPGLKEQIFSGLMQSQAAVTEGTLSSTAGKIAAVLKTAAIKTGSIGSYKLAALVALLAVTGALVTGTIMLLLPVTPSCPECGEELSVPVSPEAAAAFDEKWSSFLSSLESAGGTDELLQVTFTEEELTSMASELIAEEESDIPAGDVRIHLCRDTVIEAGKVELFGLKIQVVATVSVDVQDGEHKLKINDMDVGRLPVPGMVKDRIMSEFGEKIFLPGLATLPGTLESVLIEEGRITLKARPD